MLLLGAAWPQDAEAQRCPLPEGTLGYPVTALAADGVPLDSAFLAEVVRAAAYRWAVPSRRRERHVGWERIRNRVLTPEPLWAEDWKPAARHRARITVVIDRSGQARSRAHVEGSGDRFFDRSLATIVESPMPGAPEFPRLPAAIEADSAAITLVFGEEDVVGGAIIRFAAQQRPVRVPAGQLRVTGPRAVGTPDPRFRRATVKYDVNEHGSVDPGSIEILQSSDIDLSQAIEQALRRARFTPAQANCRAVAQTVVQLFG
jgi:hypothetical protein